MECKSCKGEGQIWVSSWDGDDNQVKCRDCNGEGFIREEGEQDGPLTKGLMKLVLWASGLYILYLIFI